MTIGNVTFTLNNKRVTIGTTNVEYTANNLLGAEPLSEPTTQITKTESTKISNLLKIIERFIIDGNISTGLANQAGPPVERTSAQDVKDDLLEMSQRREVTVMSYEGTSYNVTFEKISVREVAQDLGTSDAPDGVIRYKVKLSLVVGDLLF